MPSHLSELKRRLVYVNLQTTTTNITTETATTEYPTIMTTPNNTSVHNKTMTIGSLWCQSRTFIDPPRVKTALVSFPGSGNPVMKPKLLLL